MKYLKLLALLMVVLAGMRLGSWIIGWILAKATPIRAKSVSIFANLAAFAVFAVLLVRDLMPGEPVDVAALVFGAVVFSACFWTDRYWRPWKS